MTMKDDVKNMFDQIQRSLSVSYDRLAELLIDQQDQDQILEGIQQSMSDLIKIRDQIDQNQIRVPIDGGELVATQCLDPDYPGIDVEFEPNIEVDKVGLPRVLVEKPNGEKLRTLIWGDLDQEDYTTKVEFDEVTA